MKDLIEEIEKLREDLTLLVQARSDSLTDPLVVMKSQELDQILNLFYRKAEKVG